MKNRLIQLLRANTTVAQAIKVQLSSDVAHVFLKGVISADFGVSAQDLRDAFDQSSGADVKLHVNSPGGDVFEAREMQSVIAGYKGKVFAQVEGIAASAATIVSMSASTVAMLKGSRYMIHNGWTLAMGDRHDMLDMHNVLASFDAELAAEYAKHTGGAVEQMSNWMDAETWFTAEDAKKYGFVSDVIENTKNEAALGIANAWNLSAYKNAPAPEDPPNNIEQWAATRVANARRLKLLELT